MTEEQRRQTPASEQPGGLPIFVTAAALLVGRRCIRVFSLLAPCIGAKSPATRPLPVSDLGSLLENAGCLRVGDEALAAPKYGDVLD